MQEVDGHQFKWVWRCKGLQFCLIRSRRFSLLETATNLGTVMFYNFFMCGQKNLSRKRWSTRLAPRWPISSWSSFSTVRWYFFGSTSLVSHRALRLRIWSFPSVNLFQLRIRILVSTVSPLGSCLVGHLPFSLYSMTLKMSLSALWASLSLVGLTWLMLAFVVFYTI